MPTAALRAHARMPGMQTFATSYALCKGLWLCERSLSMCSNRIEPSFYNIKFYEFQGICPDSREYTNIQKAAVVAMGEWCCLDLAIARLSDLSAPSAPSLPSLRSPPTAAGTLTNGKPDVPTKASKSAENAKGALDAMTSMHRHTNATCDSGEAGRFGAELLMQLTHECWLAPERGLCTS
jgi:hypothetical protein